MVRLEERAPNKFGIEFCPKFKEFRVCFDTAYCWKLKIYCWKHYSKIIFKLWIVPVGPNFKVTFTFFRTCWSMNSARDPRENVKRLPNAHLINHRTDTRFKFITSNKKKSFCYYYYYYLSILQFFDVIFCALKVKINIHKKQKLKTQSKFT